MYDNDEQWWEYLKSIQTSLEQLIGSDRRDFEFKFSRLKNYRFYYKKALKKDIQRQIPKTKQKLETRKTIFYDFVKEFNNDIIFAKMKSIKYD